MHLTAKAPPCCVGHMPALFPHTARRMTVFVESAPVCIGLQGTQGRAMIGFQQPVEPADNRPTRTNTTSPSVCWNGGCGRVPPVLSTSQPSIVFGTGPIFGSKIQPALAGVPLHMALSGSQPVGSWHAGRMRAGKGGTSHSAERFVRYRRNPHRVRCAALKEFGEVIDAATVNCNHTSTSA